MACILNIETATRVCSVALSVDGEIIFSEISSEGPSHAVLLGVFVEKAMDAVKSGKLTLDAVAVSSGPGSYTGLRIGVSMAKGICFGSNIPLVSVPTLKIMARRAVMLTGNAKGIYYPMLDARRMEVYSSLFDAGLNEIRPTEAEIIGEGFLDAVPGGGAIYLFGDGAEKCKGFATSPRAHFIDHIDPLAGDMAAFAEEAFRRGETVDPAYFEPFYLKEFQATIAKNKVL